MDRLRLDTNVEGHLHAANTLIAKVIAETNRLQDYVHLQDTKIVVHLHLTALLEVRVPTEEEVVLYAAVDLHELKCLRSEFQKLMTIKVSLIFVI
jgi:hypothetical protein